MTPHTGKSLARRHIQGKAHRNSENSEILTITDFQIGRLLEILTLQIGRKHFTENLFSLSISQKQISKLGKTLRSQPKTVCRIFNFHSDG